MSMPEVKIIGSKGDTTPTSPLPVAYDKAEFGQYLDNQTRKEHAPDQTGIEVFSTTAEITDNTHLAPNGHYPDITVLEQRLVDFKNKIEKVKIIAGPVLRRQH